MSAYLHEAPDRAKAIQQYACGNMESLKTLKALDKGKGPLELRKAYAEAANDIMHYHAVNVSEHEVEHPVYPKATWTLFRRSNRVTDGYWDYVSKLCS